MKNMLLLLLSFVLFTGTLDAQNVVYVKWNAPGNNDGSTWNDAYRDLQDALTNASDLDMIWLSEGVYYPGGFTPDTNSTFRIDKPVHIYGGFSGAETTLDQRDIEQNPVIISGDLARNDVPGDFFQNRNDNARHVFTVANGTEFPTRIDGVTITGGHATDNGDLPIENFGGGGILSFRNITLSNCRFTNNFARSGGAVAVIDSIDIAGLTAATRVSNCLFEENRASSQSAGIFMENQLSPVVENCRFVSNQTTRGALYFLRCENAKVTRSSFEDNINNGGFGGAFFNWNCINTVMDSCQFIGNSAGNGGGMYIDGRELSEKSFTITNSQFRENFTSSRGASIYSFSAGIEVNNCLFENNAAPNSTAGGIHLANNDTRDTTLIMNSRFFGNNSGWGPAIANYGENTYSIIRNCEFESNQAVTSGGACTNGFKATAIYEDCYFLGNTAQFGGALYIQNDTTSVTVTNSEFSGNVASSSGGAFFNGAGTKPSFTNCEFIANQAEFGGGMSIFDSENNHTEYQLINCVFNFNIAAEQGGALNIGNANGYLENCLIINNFADGTGTGAAMSINGSEGQSANTLIMNSTVAENFGDLAAGIAQWTDGIDGTAELWLQNSIFRHSDGLNYAIEDGSPTVLSFGGNVCSEASLADLLDDAIDVKMDPEFVDDANDDYHLTPSSPGIDAGILDGAPTTDLDGNPRDAKPDAGCYEYQNPNGVDWFAAQAEKVLISPNPVRDQFNFEWPEKWTGTVIWLVVDMNGRHISNGRFEAITGQEGQWINVENMIPGNYHLLLIHRDGKAIGTFQKM